MTRLSNYTVAALADAKALTINLAALPNDASPARRVHYDALVQAQTNAPPDNPVANAGAILGHVLFHDRTLSIDDNVSCASCHRQDNGFSDAARFSVGFNTIDSTTASHVIPTFAVPGTIRSNGLDAGETRVVKSPSLKNVSLTGPYMHHGRFATLDQVVQHDVGGVQPGPALDNRLRLPNGQTVRLALGASDRPALVACMRTLTDGTLIADPRVPSLTPRDAGARAAPTRSNCLWCVTTRGYRA